MTTLETRIAAHLQALRDAGQHEHALWLREWFRALLGGFYAKN
jgi:hypothetical protein